MAQIVLRNLSKEFDKGNKAVKDLNLTINDGEFLVLVGPSGCGKSTTLRLIAGLEEPTNGEIQIGDTIMNNIPPKDRDIAMVFQNYALYPHMTVYENMAFGLKLRKFSKKEIKARVEETAALLEISHLLQRKPRQLSGGQRQRVALGRALVRKPKVFLFDEPLSNLDAKLRVQMRTEIKKLHHRLQTTMVYVTHDQIEAMTMGDRIAVMKDGIIHQIDTPINLYNNPADLFVAGFIGSPAMNFINVVMKKEERLYADESCIRIPIPVSHSSRLDNYINRQIVIGIRPEDIHLTPKLIGSPADIVEVELLTEVYEPMGAETFVHFTTGKTAIVCRTTAFDLAQPINTRLKVYFDPEKMFYFEPETQKRL